jgi:hypothetical protein
METAYVLEFQEVRSASMKNHCRVVESAGNLRLHAVFFYVLPIA